MPNGDKLYGGTLADFDSVDNMAKEIESAFQFIRGTAAPVGGGINQGLPTGPNAQDMRMLFVAIARGVIQHLVNNPRALKVEVSDGTLTTDGTVTSVSVF